MKPCIPKASAVAEPERLRRLAGRWLAVAAVLGSSWIAGASELPLTSIRQIRGLSAEEALPGLPVELRAVVTFADDAGLVFIADDSGGVYVDSAPSGLKQGDAVSVRGVTAPGRSVTIIDGAENTGTEMKVIGRGLLPEPRVIPPGKVAELEFNGQWTALTGRVLQVSHAGGRAVVELDAAGQRVRGLIPGIPRAMQAPAWLEGLEVTLLGIPGPAAGETGDFAAQFFIQSPRDIVSYARTVDALFAAAPAGEYGLMDQESAVPRRGKVSGQIAHLEPGSGFFLINETGTEWFRAIWVDAAETAGLRVNQRVEAFGRFELVKHERYLREALVRPLRPDDPPLPLVPDRTMARSFDPANAQHGRLLTFDGQLVRHQQGVAGEDIFVVAVADQVLCVRVRGNVGGDWPIGAQVRASGLWLVRDTDVFGAIPAGFSGLLLPGSPDDIKVTALPSWWTPQRWMRLAAAALVIAAVVTVWNFLLRSRVARQTKIIQQKLEHEVVWEERNRIARELHDTLEQQLAGITMQLEATTARLGDSPEAARGSLDLMKAMVQHSRGEARRSIWDLRSHTLETLGLVGALEELAASHSGERMPAFDVVSAGDVRRLPRPIEFHLLRVAQEAVTNVLKHGAATRVAISVDYTPESVRLVVHDDGRGFDVRARTAGAHFGLLGMQERSAKLDGVLEIDSRPGNGTTISLTVPLAAAPDMMSLS